MRDWNAAPISHEAPKPCLKPSSLTLKSESTAWSVSGRLRSGGKTEREQIHSGYGERYGASQVRRFIGSSNWTGPMRERTMVTENLVDRLPLDADDRLVIRSVRVVEI